MADLDPPWWDAADHVQEYTLGDWSLITTPNFGPRILDARKDSSPNLFARLSSAARIERDDGPPFFFHGGHRLWASPEVPPVTYAPDSHPCEINFLQDGLSVVAPPDSAGIMKSISAHARGDSLLVEHSLLNAGPTPVEVGVWAITQFRMGGTALLPVDGSSTQDELQANRHVSVWPYSNLADPRILWVSGGIELEASAGPRLKLGSGPDPRHTGYLLDGVFFSKTITSADEAQVYPDRGAVGQVFIGQDFCELESTGPIVRLDPEQATSATETWDIVNCPDLSTAWAMMGT